MAIEFGLRYVAMIMMFQVWGRSAKPAVAIEDASGR